MEESNARILFIGADSPEMASVAKILEERVGACFQLHWEARLDDVRERLEEEGFELLMLILPFEEESASEVVAELRQRAPLASILTLSTADGDTGGEDALRAGALDHLVLEGLDPEALIRSVRMAEARADLQRALERERAIAVGARDGLWDWDLKSNRVRYSTRWAEMLGLASDDLEGSPDDWFLRVHPRDLERLEAAIQAHLEGDADMLSSEYRIRHADGSDHWMCCRAIAVRDLSGRPVLLAGSQTDVTELRNGESSFLLEALRDPLTGLPARALFFERLGQAITRSHSQGGQAFAVIVLDLDRFQAINESLGHTAGDRLLAEMTDRLSCILRPGDTLTRLGSDKFAILLDSIEGPVAAAAVAEDARTRLEGPFVLEGEEIFVTAGIGIALSTPEYNRPEDVMRDAYTAMHRAKEKDGTRYEIFDPEMQARSMERLRLESDLRRAMDRREFVLHYQPIVSMANREIVGFEALIRWQHPERGLVFPGAFVPLAEETGTIVSIDRWVLQRACETLARWQKHHRSGVPPGMSVNLSGRQFDEDDLVEAVSGTIERTGIDPSGLKLEITESVLMKASSAGQLRGLLELGVELALDDFGTGYSSLGSLHRFPISILKIDRRFVGSMDVERGNAEIVQTIITLARNLDMAVVAEGVETPAQHTRLQELGCHFGQGYLFSNALDADSASRSLLSLSI